MAGNCAEAGRSVTSKITSILLTFTEGSEHSLKMSSDQDVLLAVILTAEIQVVGMP